MSLEEALKANTEALNANTAALAGNTTPVEEKKPAAKKAPAKKAAAKKEEKAIEGEVVSDFDFEAAFAKLAVTINDLANKDRDAAFAAMKELKIGKLGELEQTEAKYAEAKVVLEAALKGDTEEASFV